MEDPYVVLGREIKLAVVGDARVGKTSWISHLAGENYAPEYTPTVGHQCNEWCFSTNLGRARINIWELSGSHNIAEDRAKCIEDSDAAVIMVDTGDRTSIENAVNWYREVMSFRKNSDNSATLPVIIYSFKAYKQDNKRDIEPAGISWLDELGDTPFIRNPYLELPGSRRLESYRCGCRPIGWILEQLTGESNVEFYMIYPPEPGQTPSPTPYDPQFESAKTELYLPPSDDDSDL